MCYPDLNQQDYRVAFVIDDKFSIGKRILNMLVAGIMLGFYYQTQGLLIIGERIETSQ